MGGGGVKSLPLLVVTNLKGYKTHESIGVLLKFNRFIKQTDFQRV
jgi:hypothetical protein